MTEEEREDAINVLSSSLLVNGRGNGKTRLYNAIMTAIEALKTEPCEDCVSREFMYKLGAKCIAARDENGELVAITSIESLPPVTPKPKWIPIKENPFSELPKDRRVLVTKEDSYGYRYVSDVAWDLKRFDDDVMNVVAYMDYYEPEPYKEGES